ncbi:MAG: hypothetical protein FJ257_10025 [Phycisphaerae bacterium]|nr:hypothetical protein [Phycisphaerae bacterium]
MASWIEFVLAVGGLSGWGMFVLQVRREWSERQRRIESLEATRTRLEEESREAGRAGEELRERGATLTRKLRRQYQQTIVLRRMVNHLSERLAPIEGKAAVTIRRKTAESVRDASTDRLKLESAYSSIGGVEAQLAELEAIERGEPSNEDRFARLRAGEKPVVGVAA